MPLHFLPPKNPNSSENNSAKKTVIRKESSNLYMASGLEFVKMHGLGNDFVIIDVRSNPLNLTAEQVQRIADRRYGIGCDQLITIGGATGEADASMRIYNANGLEVEACGNAARCVVWLLSQQKPEEKVTLLSKGNLLEGRRDGEKISVNMGKPRMEWQEIPLSMPCDTLRLQIDYYPLINPVAVNMGNPHAVFFVSDADEVNLTLLGPGLENHALFPEHCNIEVAQILAPDRIRMRVWERGVGVTPACGTGACATVVAAIRRNLIPQRHATVVLDGGELEVAWEDDVIMTGGVSLVASGILDESLLCLK